MEDKHCSRKKLSGPITKLSWEEWLKASDLLAEKILAERDGQPVALDEAWNQLLEERDKRVDQILGSEKE